MSFDIIPHSRPWIVEDDYSAVSAVLRSGMIDQGNLTKEFEKSVSNQLGVNGGVAVSSGTSALILALHVIGVKSETEVILPTYVCRSVMEAIQVFGAKPVFCDVGTEWAMTPHSVEDCITEKTSAIIAVHIFGIPVDVQSMMEFGLPVIEDSCQALGTEVGGKPSGAVGTVGVFSFHATKCIATGEGGMMVSSNDIFIEKARTMRDLGSASLPRVAAPFTDFQAALGLSQLKRYPDFLDRRRLIRDAYVNAYRGTHENISVWRDYTKNPYLFRLPLKMSRGFEEAHREFLRHGIQVRRGVDTLLHRETGLSDNLFPNSINLFNATVSIPFYPALQDVEIERLCDALSILTGVG